MRRLVSSGSPYEPKVGISRAVRAGAIVEIEADAVLDDVNVDSEGTDVD